MDVRRASPIQRHKCQSEHCGLDADPKVQELLPEHRVRAAMRPHHVRFLVAAQNDRQKRIAQNQQKCIELKNDQMDGVHVRFAQNYLLIAQLSARLARGESRLAELKVEDARVEAIKGRAVRAGFAVGKASM